MMSHRSRMFGQSHCIVEAGGAERPRDIAVSRIKVEIASDHQDRLVDVPGAVGKNLVQLSEAKSVVASALQVKVISHHLAGMDRCFGNESDPSAEPALKDRNIGHKPPRLPERGL